MKNILLAVVLACPLVSWAQEIKPFDAKPGLWERAVTSEITGMPAMPPMAPVSDETLAKLPPAQRAQVEAAMKGRGSMGTPQTITTKYCVTRESLSKPMYNDSGKTCTNKLVNSTANTQQVHVECTPTGMKMVGDVTIQRVDAEHTKGTMVAKTSGGDSGRSIDTKMTINSKWLSSDCGDVKPLGEK